jgi:peptidoglycan/LPS O-acetylase OafA/YrhL
MHHHERFQNNYDFLRLFAAFSIIFYHSFSLLHQAGSEPLMQLTKGRLNFSLIGLSIFFCISGFLIAKSAARSPGVVNYLWKRFLRIQPLLIVTCILTVFICVFFSNLSAKDYFSNRHTWSYFRNIMPVFGLQFTLPGVFVHNIAEHGVNGSLWTLILEERLYILMSIIFLLRKKYKSYIVLFIAVLNFFYLANRFFFDGEMVRYFTSLPFFYALLFLNSAALYFLKINFSNSLFFFVSFSLVAFITGVLFPSLNFLYFFSIPVLVNSVAQIKGITNHAGKYGDFTYGIYVFSFPVQQMFIAAGVVKENPFALFLYTIVIVFPMAVLSWNLVEKKCLKLKKLVGMHQK